jgi:hypothetical protein
MGRRCPVRCPRICGSGLVGDRGEAGGGHAGAEAGDVQGASVGAQCEGVGLVTFVAWTVVGAQPLLRAGCDRVGDRRVVVVTAVASSAASDVDGAAVRPIKVPGPLFSPTLGPATITVRPSGVTASEPPASTELPGPPACAAGVAADSWAAAVQLTPAMLTITPAAVTVAASPPRPPRRQPTSPARRSTTKRSRRASTAKGPCPCHAARRARK